jgi:hypothetical protein
MYNLIDAIKTMLLIKNLLFQKKVTSMWGMNKPAAGQTPIIKYVHSG